MCAEAGLDGTIDGDDEVRVRLALPSGRRIEGTFASRHAAGLVYDLALLLLAEGELLWSEGGDDRDGAPGDGYAVGDDPGTPGTADHGVVRNEWERIFRPFSIVAFPQQRLDDLDATLEDCGLGCGAALRVAIASN